MISPDSGCYIRYRQIWCYPIEVGVRRKQTVEFVYALLVGLPVRLHEEFRHGDSGRYGCVIRPLDPRKDVARQNNVSGIRLQLVNENASVQRDTLMTAKERAKLSQSQLRRSF